MDVLCVDDIMGRIELAVHAGAIVRIILGRASTEVVAEMLTLAM